MILEFNLLQKIVNNAIIFSGKIGNFRSNLDRRVKFRETCLCLYFVIVSAHTQENAHTKYAACTREMNS